MNVEHVNKLYQGHDIITLYIIKYNCQYYLNNTVWLSCREKNRREISVRCRLITNGIEDKAVDSTRRRRTDRQFSFGNTVHECTFASKY